ncbi:MAG: CHASE domain-containing protein, partial [Kiritimatiellae bacterium]|nr:CHASE domain-containing protein [Kiritimatiellia bacterium]
MSKDVDHEQHAIAQSAIERKGDDQLASLQRGGMLSAGGRIHRSALFSGFGMILVLLIGAGASFLAFEASYRAEEERTRLQFDGYASTLLTGVNKELALYFRVLESMGSLYDLSEQISTSDFNEFAEKGLGFSRDILGAYGFAQWIPQSYRLLLEQDPEDAFSIVDRGRQGFQPAPVRSGYVPLMFQDPPDGLDIPRGFDLARDPEMASAMQRAFSRGGPA